MFVDASALTAMITDESDARALIARLQNYPKRVSSPLAIWDTVIAIANDIAPEHLELSIKDAEVAVETYLKLMSIEVVGIHATAHHLALEAFDRFGKGRHPAGLNFGDCFSYACAKTANMPSLYKGDDFPQTDILTA